MLGAFFKELRMKGISLKEIAKTIGLNYGHVRNLATGGKSPSIEVVIKLAESYEVSTDKVLGRESYGTTSSKSTCSRGRGDDDNGSGRTNAFHSLDNIAG